LSGIGGRVSYPWGGFVRAVKGHEYGWDVWLESEDKRSGEWNVFKMSAMGQNSREMQYDDNETMGKSFMAS